MFVDVAKIKIKAGDGGNGAVSFHREKYVASGGPDGGDGGRGGDIIFVPKDNLSTLADFRYKRKYVAENGQNGRAKRCFGKNGASLEIEVPRGTVVKDAETGRIIADVSSNEPVIVAKGGWGNYHFATPTRQCPRFAKSGTPGVELEVILELKLLADVGLVGFPNVGKSTLISVVSDAKPVIANYHFTTLSPVLGVVRIAEGASFVMADIPGLINGASEGVGLGHQFLRHVDRCRLLVHVVDVSGSEGRNPIKDFDEINAELAAFNEDLASRPMIVAGNKCDMVTDEELQSFKDYVTQKGYEFYPIIAPICEGTQELMNAVYKKLTELPPIKQYEAEPVVIEEYAEKLKNNDFTITVTDGIYNVEGKWLLKILSAVDLDDYESLQYFQRTLISSGIINALKEKGINEGDIVSIYDIEFEFVP